MIYDGQDRLLKFSLNATEPLIPLEIMNATDTSAHLSRKAGAVR